MDLKEAPQQEPWKSQSRSPPQAAGLRTLLLLGKRFSGLGLKGLKLKAECKTPTQRP